MIDPDRHMSVFRLWPALVIFGAGASGAYAAEPMTGRWAQDAAAGGVKKPLLIVSDIALRWGDDDCRIGTQYRTGDTLHLEAFCLGAHGKRTPPHFAAAGGLRDLESRRARLIAALRG